MFSCRIWINNGPNNLGFQLYNSQPKHTNQATNMQLYIFMELMY